MEKVENEQEMEKLEEKKERMGWKTMREEIVSG
jgi:hypothetical protein